MKSVSCLSLVASLTHAFSLPAVEKRQAGGAVASTAFLRRAYASSAVLNGYVYIDGGEFSYASGGSTQLQYSSTLLAIDLSSDWTNSTVNIKSNSKPSGVPDLNEGGIWVDESNGLLYTGFAGLPSSFGNAAYQDYGLWSFKPNGQGGGSWASLNSSADARFKTEARPYSALVGSGNGVGYMLGGYTLNATGSRISSSGLVSYNFTSKSLTQSTVTGITNGGVVQKGGAHFVPSFGSEGVLLTFAGMQVDAAGYDSFLDAGTVQIYDPSTGKWYEQTTSGNIPEARKEFCMTGAASNNKTYEIFVYAGWGGNLGGAALPYDEAFVLSLPSFNWFKIDYPPANPRHGLTCQSIGGGQILTIGGVNTSTNGPDSLYDDVFKTKDQYTQGLAIFDLGTMGWKSSYSSKQTSYTPSSEVQRYYASNSRTPTWSASELSAIFAVENFNASTTTPPNSATTTSGSSSSGSGSQSSPSKTPSHVGAIAGAVVGGVVGLVLIAGAVVLLMRRRKNRRVAAAGGDQPNLDNHYSEMSAGSNARHEMMGTQAAGTPIQKGELYAKYGPVSQHEMPVDERRHELA